MSGSSSMISILGMGSPNTGRQDIADSAARRQFTIGRVRACEVANETLLCTWPLAMSACQFRVSPDEYFGRTGVARSHCRLHRQGRAGQTNGFTADALLRVR